MALCLAYSHIMVIKIIKRNEIKDIRVNPGKNDGYNIIDIRKSAGGGIKGQIT